MNATFIIQSLIVVVYEALFLIQDFTDPILQRKIIEPLGRLSQQYIRARMHQVTLWVRVYGFGQSVATTSVNGVHTPLRTQVYIFIFAKNRYLWPPKQILRTPHDP